MSVITSTTGTNRDDTNRTGPSTNTSSIKRWLSLKEWDNINTTGKLSDDDAKKGVSLMIQFESFVSNDDFNEDVKNYRDAAAQDVSKLRSWAKHEIVSMILAEAQQQNIKCEDGSEVTEVGQLYQLFQGDGSIKTATKLWHCFYGVFDRREGWELQLEKQFMDERKWRYRSIYRFVCL